MSDIKLSQNEEELIYFLHHEFQTPLYAFKIILEEIRAKRRPNDTQIDMLMADIEAMSALIQKVKKTSPQSVDMLKEWHQESRK